MPRCIIEETDVLDDFEDRIDARPDLGFVVATADATSAEGSVTVEFDEVGCCPLSLVTIARALLDAAEEMLALSSLDAERAVGLAAYIAAGRRALADPFAFERLS